MTTQNTSHAVMAQKHEYDDMDELFPTPPWATRALCEFLREQLFDLSTMSCWEPACGKLHMVRPLREYFGEVEASDITDYGVGASVHDFLAQPRNLQHNFMITNPAFSKAADFVLHALKIVNPTVGVAILARTNWVEGGWRYENLFSVSPPTFNMPFVERVPINKGFCLRKNGTATSYSWFVWLRHGQGVRLSGRTETVWIAPCRKRLEKWGDYDDDVVASVA